MSRAARLAFLIAIGSFALPASTHAGLLGRDRDPVVLTGASLPALLGAVPDRIVAFRYDGGWIQIPVQVDERAVVDFATIYHDPTPSGFTLLTYTDPETFTGPDPDPAFDADDELVFMAKEAGALHTGEPLPTGTIAGTGMRVRVRDPIGSGVGFVYLFASDGTLDPGPGADAVSNAFYLLPVGAPYKSQYDTQTGPNPEHTVISSPFYSVHFSDRWICNGMSVAAGGASGVDILDRRKSLYAPGNCTRSEQTFSNGEGAFIVNRQGPVRVLRGYCGANSGPTTHRIHKFYEAREDVVTVLRVHPIPSVMDFFDYSPAASGMTYRNDLNPTGVTIDGSPDLVANGPFHWEMVTGPQGTLVMSGLADTDIPGFSFSSYYQDLAPAPGQCTGDDSAYGASGLRIPNAIPNTDPALGAYNTFVATRVIAYDGPGKDAAFAGARALEAQQPLATTVEPYESVTAVGAPKGTATFRIAVVSLPAAEPVRFRVDLPGAGDVGLEILDVNGRRIALVAQGAWSAGSHQVAWSARGTASGVYFARVRTGTLGQRVVRFIHAR